VFCVCEDRSKIIVLGTKQQIDDGVSSSRTMHVPAISLPRELPVKMVTEPAECLLNKG
jgi:hypothetical protein